MPCGEVGAFTPGTKPGGGFMPEEGPPTNGVVGGEGIERGGPDAVVMLLFCSEGNRGLELSSM